MWNIILKATTVNNGTACDINVLLGQGKARSQNLGIVCFISPVRWSNPDPDDQSSVIKFNVKPNSDNHTKGHYQVMLMLINSCLAVKDYKFIYSQVVWYRIITYLQVWNLNYKVFFTDCFASLVNISGARSAFQLSKCADVQSRWRHGLVYVFWPLVP